MRIDWGILHKWNSLDHIRVEYIINYIVIIYAFIHESNLVEYSTEKSQPTCQVFRIKRFRIRMLFPRNNIEST